MKNLILSMLMLSSITTFSQDSLKVKKEIKKELKQEKKEHRLERKHH